MTPEERTELDDLTHRVTELENLTDYVLEPDPNESPEAQHEAFVARIRARKGKA